MATATKTDTATSVHSDVLGLKLTKAESHQLSSGESISLEGRSLEEMSHFLQNLSGKLNALGQSVTWGDVASNSSFGKCRGIEIIAIDDNCGLYWRFPMTLEECCRE